MAQPRQLDHIDPCDPFPIRLARLGAGEEDDAMAGRHQRLRLAAHSWIAAVVGVRGHQDPRHGQVSFCRSRSAEPDHAKLT